MNCPAGKAALDQQFSCFVVRNLRSQAADLRIASIARGATGSCFLRYENKVFTTNDEARLARQREDDSWWVNVAGSDFHLIPDAPVHGGRAGSALT